MGVPDLFPEESKIFQGGGKHKWYFYKNKLKNIQFDRPGGGKGTFLPSLADLKYATRN